ncbi:MAG: DUF1997 domain-containing protein [Cyanobacteria bacterium J06638_20]
MLQLFTHQSVNLEVSQGKVPLRHYLRQPRRLMHALMNPSQVEELGGDCFRLKLRAIQFLMLSIRPVVDLHIDSSRERYLRVRSVDCRIEGNEFVNERFHLTLSGILALQTRGKVAQVEGHAKLAIAVDLPPALQFTPKPLLEVTGNSILQGILMTMKQRLMRQLVMDYELWNTQQTAQQPTLLAHNVASTQTP